MPPKEPSPRRVAAAVAAVASGRSLRDVADEYGVSFVTVSRWVAKHKAQAAKAPKKPKPAAKAAHPWTGITATLAERSEPPPPADEGPEEAEGGTLLEQVQGLQRAMLATARESKRVGNMKAAQAALASAGLLANTIARISKTEAEGADVFRVSMAEIKATEESLRARLGTMRGRPLCCAVCSRKLSVAMAYEGREMPDVIREYLESEA